MRFRMSAVAILVPVGLITLASAQVNPFNKYTQGLSQTDLDLLQAAAAKLYTSSNPVGASREWANAKTGNSGVVRITGVKTPCVQLRHTIRQSGQADDRVFVVSRCYVNGTWQSKF